MSQRLLIVGASIRPWITSARRAGLEICAFDFFADWDAQFWLKQEMKCPDQHPGGTIERIDRFDEVFKTRHWQTCDLALICGGFENSCDLVRQVADRMPVLGPEPVQLERIACPVELFGRLEAAGFSVPETRSEFSPDQRHLDWLQKSATSSSGLGVQAVDPNRPVSPGSSDLFFQQRIDGESVSAIFVSVSEVDGANISTRRLGASRQLVGDQAFGAAEFRYCGSIGPIEMTPDLTLQIDRVGQYLAREYGITGVWGVDFMVNQDGVFPVDINPRVTASAELLDSLILNSSSSLTGIVDVMLRSGGEQAQRAGLFTELDRVGTNLDQPFVEGKAVLFNCGQTPVQITPRLFAELLSSFDRSFFGTSRYGYSIADVPCPGQGISIGYPILTVRVRCRDESEVRRELSRKAAQLFGVVGIVS